MTPPCDYASSFLNVQETPQASILENTVVTQSSIEGLGHVYGLTTACTRTLPELMVWITADQPSKPVTPAISTSCLLGRRDIMLVDLQAAFRQEWRLAHNLLLLLFATRPSARRSRATKALPLSLYIISDFTPLVKIQLVLCYLPDATHGRHQWLQWCPYLSIQAQGVIWLSESHGFYFFSASHF